MYGFPSYHPIIPNLIYYNPRCLCSTIMPRSITPGSPAARARSAAASSTTPMGSQTALAPAAMAWSTNGPTRSEDVYKRQGQRRGVAAAGRAVGWPLEPAFHAGWREVAEGFVARRDPALLVKVVAGGQGVGAGGVHAQAPTACAAWA